MEALVFSLKRQEIPVVLQEVDGTEGKFTLREMDGLSRDRYITASSKSMTISKDGTAKVESFDGMMANLISLCLFDCEDKSVSVKVIQSFPASVSDDLYKACSDMNKLGKDTDKKEEEAKND